MTKDKALEDLFLTQKPHFDDHDAFMANLTKRLDAVEFIHQQQEATIRRYKMAMIVAFIVGILSGAITMAFILSTPADVPLFTFQVQTSFLLWFTEISRPVVAAALALLMTIGIISVIINIQDINTIMNMNKKTIITIMLVLVTVAGQAQEHVVWENPSAFMGESSAEFKVTKVELKQTETVLHFHTQFPSTGSKNRNYNLY